MYEFVHGEKAWFPVVAEGAVFFNLILLLVTNSIDKEVRVRAVGHLCAVPCRAVCLAAAGGGMLVCMWL